MESLTAISKPGRWGGGLFLRWEVWRLPYFYQPLIFRVFRGLKCPVFRRFGALQSIRIYVITKQKTVAVLFICTATVFHPFARFGHTKTNVPAKKINFNCVRLDCIWWSIAGSNRWPPHCQCGALLSPSVTYPRNRVCEMHFNTQNKSYYLN